MDGVRIFDSRKVKCRVKMPNSKNKERAFEKRRHVISVSLLFLEPPRKPACMFCQMDIVCYVWLINSRRLIKLNRTCILYIVLFEEDIAVYIMKFVIWIHNYPAQRFIIYPWTLERYTHSILAF